METENKTEKGKTTGLHREILKTGLLHKEFCVQSLWEVLYYRNKRKEQKMSPQGCKKTGMCVHVHVHYTGARPALSLEKCLSVFQKS